MYPQQQKLQAGKQMLDNIVNMTFNNTFPDGGNYSGNINVDYSVNSVTGNFSASVDGYSYNWTLGTGVQLYSDTSNPASTEYSFVGRMYPGSIGDGNMGIALTWAGEAPQAFDSVSLTYPGNNIYGINVSTSDAPVNSTVISVCLASGCMIATARGDVLVEELQLGDRVLTASGAHRGVRWIGHRVVDCTGSEAAVHWPVRIARHAFGANRPNRDLLVSPGHAICVTPEMEATVRAFDLINGALVAQVEVDAITYWHVELDSHDIIFANGLPVESYLDEGNRAFFSRAEGSTHEAYQPVQTRCRPQITEGAFLEAARARLLKRSFDLGWRQRQEPMSELRVVCNGATVSPRVQGDCALFDLSDGCGDVWLVSEATAPLHIGINVDARKLGLDFADICIFAGELSVDVELDDPRLGDGFHQLETLSDGSLRRWTNGRARIPASILRDVGGAVTLQAKVRQGLPRWVPPAPEALPFS
jgi:hypothetical protein